ncbi:MAG: hypothetical protein IJO09_04105 [Oscillospiraceae bacterium]|nr:hypothetical protein [Oscillospiraceae bacterium]
MIVLLRRIGFPDESRWHRGYKLMFVLGRNNVVLSGRFFIAFAERLEERICYYEFERR